MKELFKGIEVGDVYRLNGELIMIIAVGYEKCYGINDFGLPSLLTCVPNPEDKVTYLPHFEKCLECMRNLE